MQLPACKFTLHFKVVKICKLFDLLVVGRKRDAKMTCGGLGEYCDITERELNAKEHLCEQMLAGYVCFGENALG